MRELRYYLSKAEIAKEPFRDTYNDVLEFTSAIYDINDSEPIEPSFHRNIEPVISTSVQSYVNFLMGTMFQRGQHWGEVKVNDVVYRSVNGLTIDALIDGKINDINEQLEEATKVAFEYLNSSNFYLEITKVITEAAILGTAVYKFVPHNDVAKPFSFEYVPLDNFFFYEDSTGAPSYCFRKFYGFTAEDITFNFPEATIPQELLDNPIKDMDIIESVYPVKNNGKYKYVRLVTDFSFGKVLFEEELIYNPYVVSRSNVEPNGIYGIGLGVYALESFRDLRYFNQLRKDNAELLIKPPLKAIGDKALIHNVNYAPGKLNYGGSGSVDPKTGQANSFMLEPINTSLTYLPIAEQIMKLEEDIKDIFISNPLGEVTDYKNRTMYETEARLNLFRNRHAKTFELFQTELLQPSLILPLTHLVEIGIIKFDLEAIDWFNLTQVSYINELSKAKDRENIANITGAIASVSQAIMLAPSAGLLPKEVHEALMDSYEIDYGMRYDDDKLEELQRQVEMATVLRMSGGEQGDQSTTQ
jgi:hypothetical protein